PDGRGDQPGTRMAGTRLISAWNAAGGYSAGASSAGASGASGSGAAGSSGATSSSGAPTAAGTFFGFLAGSGLTIVSLTSGFSSPSSAPPFCSPPSGSRSTITVAPGSSSARRTKSASGSSM